MHYQEDGALINLWERNGHFSQRWQCKSFLDLGERQRSQQARENELERQRQNDLALLQFDKRRLIARQEQARQEELLRNQICAVEEENKQAVQHIQSIKLSAVPVERHKIEDSSDYGRLGDAVQVHAFRLCSEPEFS